MRGESERAERLLTVEAVVSEDAPIGRDVPIRADLCPQTGVDLLGGAVVDTELALQR